MPVRWRDGRVLLTGAACVAFAGFATATSWQATPFLKGFDLPLRVVAVAAIGTGMMLWRRHGSFGWLVMVTATGFFVRDLRASPNPVVFAAGFCLAYGWLGSAAQGVVSWPSGKLTARPQRLLAVACYVLAIGSQIGRYIADRPGPGWLDHHTPNTLWAHVGSASAVSMALVVAVFLVRRWASAPPSHRPSEPVWMVFVIVAVSSAAAAAASIAGVPDGQIELVPAALALAMGVPAGWTYMRMRAQLEEVRASRRRVSMAAAEERRRIQADLHDSAQQALAAVQLRLGAVLKNGNGATGVPAPPLSQVHQELGEAIGLLRDLVQQIYPMVLRKYGLLAAVEDLADRSAIPVLLDIAAGRWGHELEITAYFVISEAVGNSMRHAEPSRIIIRVRDQEPSLLLIEVDDDGRGEAMPLARGGLASLKDRVETAGGSVELASSPGYGTRVTVLLPREARHAHHPG